MKKPIIAVDIDDVLAAEAEFVVAYTNEHWGGDYTLQDYTESWNLFWGVDVDEVERRAEILHRPGIVSRYRVIPGSRELLEQLKEKYELIVVTSRRKRVEQETQHWLDEHFPGIFSKLILTGFWDDPNVGGRHLLSKGSLLNDHRVAYVIDDQQKHCVSAVEHGIKAILYGDLSDNQHTAVREGMVHCKDWSEVAEYFGA
jgi:uncharacterized HAD superfamily protein